MDERLELNRANWDDRTGVHLTSEFYDVEDRLRERRGPRPACEIEALGDVGGLRLLHLQCHFGLDTHRVRGGRCARHRARLLAQGDRGGV